jgi:hypothetical protein
VGGKSFKSEKNKNKKKIKGKKAWGRGQGENKVVKQKLRLGLRKAKETKVNLGWHKDRKDKPISAPSIHVGGCWFIRVNSLGLLNKILLS